MDTRNPKTSRQSPRQLLLLTDFLEENVHFFQALIRGMDAASIHERGVKASLDKLTRVLWKAFAKDQAALNHRLSFHAELPVTQSIREMLTALADGDRRAATVFLTRHPTVATVIQACQYNKGIEWWYAARATAKQNHHRELLTRVNDVSGFKRFIFQRGLEKIKHTLLRFPEFQQQKKIGLFFNPFSSRHRTPHKKKILYLSSSAKNILGKLKGNSKNSFDAAVEISRAAVKRNSSRTSDRNALYQELFSYLHLNSAGILNCFSIRWRQLLPSQPCNTRSFFYKARRAAQSFPAVSPNEQLQKLIVFFEENKASYAHQPNHVFHELYHQLKTSIESASTNILENNARSIIEMGLKKCLHMFIHGSWDEQLKAADVLHQLYRNKMRLVLSESTQECMQNGFACFTRGIRFRPSELENCCETLESLQNELAKYPEQSSVVTALLRGLQHNYASLLPSQIDRFRIPVRC